MRILHFLSYLLIRSFLSLCALFPYKCLHKIGKVLGALTFPYLTRYRKRALSNLAIASSLHLSNEEIESLAKESLSNLFITSLEYGKLSLEKNIPNIAECVNPEEANEILKEGKGIIFFCAHQANWEILFLEGTSRMNGIAIGQPIANTFLYNWILRMRQKFGGTIFEPKQAVKEGLRALKKGYFLGIVGDQGMPESGFSSSFLGRPAFTSPLPALLSHRSGAPIIVAMTKRKEGRYFINYSSPIWPNKEKTMDEDVPRLMHAALHVLEEGIKENPGQWLWQHNKWKQQGPKRLKKKYRQDTIAVFLPLEEKNWDDLKVLREIYPTEFISFFIPEGMTLPENLVSEITYYKKTSELKVKDYRFKLIFNFTSDETLNEHFLRLAAFEVLTLGKIKELSGNFEDSLASQLKQVILNAS